MSSTCLNKGKTMAEFPALPLFTDAYIADTAHLTNEEHGVYLRLLMFAWRTSSCSLPDNDVRLALMVGVTKGKWNKLKPTIMSFWRLSEGEWTQKKLTIQRDFVSKQREQKRIAGVASAEARRLKTLADDPTAVDLPLPTASQQPKPIPKTTLKRDTKVSTKKATRLSDDWFLPASWGEWAVKEGYGLDGIYLEAEKFKDYWIGVGGQKGTKLNWEATWRNWLRNSKQTKGSHNGQRDSNDDALQSIARAARAR